MKRNFPIAVVGNGAGAVHAVMALRKCNYQGEIHLFSDHGLPAYNPMLTSYYVAGKIDLDSCYPFGSNLDFYKQNNVHLYLDSPVVRIDAEKQIVETNNGHRMRYAKCLVATGASSFMPPIPGISSKCVFGLRTMDDAFALKEALAKNPKKVLVVGASMTGIKLAELFLSKGLSVCLADQGKHLFPTSAYPDCAEIMENYLVQKGIKLRLGAGIKEIEEHRGGVKAYFSDGWDEEEADIVVIAIGVRPNVHFLDPGQVKIDKGILVDDTMCTSAPNLYAAGDVAQGTNILNGKKEIIGLWANARYQGRTAGRNMAGFFDRWPGNIPHNISHFLDLDFVSMGDIRQSGEVITISDPANLTYYRVVFKEGKLVGINLLNCYLMSGMLKKYFIKDENIKEVRDLAELFSLKNILGRG